MVTFPVSSCWSAISRAWLQSADPDPLFTQASRAGVQPGFLTNQVSVPTCLGESCPGGQKTRLGRGPGGLGSDTPGLFKGTRPESPPAGVLEEQKSCERVKMFSAKHQQRTKIMNHIGRRRCLISSFNLCNQSWSRKEGSAAPFAAANSPRLRFHYI